MSMQKSAKKIVSTCMNIQENEKVLIVTDTETFEIARAVFDAASSISKNTALLLMNRTNRHAEEPPSIVSEKMLGNDVIIAPTRYSLTHTSAREKATEQGARIATMPGVTKNMMQKGAINADFAKVQSLTFKVSRLLEKAKKARIISEIGTDITMSIEGRSPISDTGIFHNRGDFGNLPAGESFIAPVEGTANGKLVIDGSMMDLLVKKPFTITVKDGTVTSIEGDRVAKAIESEIEKVGPLARNIAELGIGTNDKARLTGNVLEDEKIFGTVHVAIGNNATFGGNVLVGLHFDGVMKNPTLYIDDKKILENNEFIF